MAKFGVRPVDDDEDKPRFGGGDGSKKRGRDVQAQPGFFALPPVHEHVEPRCKVCQSPFRREIDTCLATGWSHARIIRHYNGFLGENYFNRSNISRHAERHLTIRDAAVRNIIEERARALSMDVENIEGFILTRQATLDMIIQQGLEALRTGLTTSEPKDILAAVQLLEKMEQDFQATAIDEMTQQYKAFAEAVQEIVPQELHEAIFERTKDLLTERQVGTKVIRAELPPKSAPVEAEDADWEEEDD